MLEKSYSGEETCKNILANGDCRIRESAPQTPATVAHTKETETLKKKVAERTYFCKQLAKRKWQLFIKTIVEKLWLFLKQSIFRLFIAIFLFDIGGLFPNLFATYGRCARSSNVKRRGAICLISLLAL